LGLFTLEAEGPGVGAGGFDLILWKGAGAPGICSTDTGLAMVDVDGVDAALGDVAWVTEAFEIGHEEGVGAAFEEFPVEGGDVEAMAFFVRKGHPADVGAVAGFLWFGVGEEEVGDGFFVEADEGASFAVDVGLVGAVAEPSEFIVAGGDGGLHADAGEVAEFAFGRNGDVDVETVVTGHIGDSAGGVASGNFQVAGEARSVGLGGGHRCLGSGGAPHAAAVGGAVSLVVIDERAPEVEVEG